jgi:hypothetical protein
MTTCYTHDARTIMILYITYVIYALARGLWFTYLKKKSQKIRICSDICGKIKHKLHYEGTWESGDTTPHILPQH